MHTKTNHTYAAREGSRITDKDAQRVGGELDRIERQRGALRPTEIVDDARPKSAPLHDFFTWDDTEAAELFRQEEARCLIRSVVILSVEDEETPPARAFVSVVQKGPDGEKETSYISTIRALSSDEFREQVLSQAKSELAAFRARYRNLREMAEVLKAIDSIV